MQDIVFFQTGPKGTEQTTVYSDFVLNQFNIFINEHITDELAKEVIVIASHLHKKDPNKPIKIIINSPGGSISAGMAIYDYLKMLSNPIHTYGLGMCASMAAVLLICLGDKRFASENCEIMLHQPLIPNVGGQASDIKIVAEQILKTKDKINTLISKCSNLDVERVTQISDRDAWISANDAVGFGFIDGILKENTCKEGDTK